MEIKKLNLLGKEIQVKKLTVGDMFKISKLEEQDEGTQMFNIVSLAIVEPKMTVEDIYNLDAKYINDLTEIVELATNSED